MRKPSSKSRSSHRWLLKDFKNGGHEFFEERFSRDVTALANQRVNTVILTYWYRLNTLGNSAEYLVKKKSTYATLVPLVEKPLVFTRYQ